MTTPEEQAAIGVAVSEGPDLLVRLVRFFVDLAGGADKAKALIDAEYAAAEVALDIEEERKLEAETKP